MKYLLAFLLICSATAFAENSSCARAKALSEMARQMESDLGCTGKKAKPVQNLLNCNAGFAEDFIRQKIAKTEKNLNDLKERLAAHESVSDEENFIDVDDDGNYTNYLQRKIKNKEQQIKDLNDLLVGMQMLKMRFVSE